MMILVGSILLLVGLASGVALILPPLGLMTSPGWYVWLAFPVATLAGHLVVGLGRNVTATRFAALAAGALSLFLAIGATVIFFANSTNLLPLQGDITSLWVLTGVGFIQGGLFWSLGMRMSSAPAA